MTHDQNTPRNTADYAVGSGMPAPLATSGELSIYVVGELRSSWMAWVDSWASANERLSGFGAAAAPDQVPVRPILLAAAIDVIDAAGVQLLLALDKALGECGHSLLIQNPGSCLQSGCGAMGLGDWLSQRCVNTDIGTPSSPAESHSLTANGDHDQSFIQDALPIFISESLEQVEAIEQLLLELEESPGDDGLLNALFRCAHTVKGSAGIFGLDAIVGFTHHVETLLDRLREGKLPFTPALSTLLLRCNDQLRQLVIQARDVSAEPAQAAQTRAALVAQLEVASGAVQSAPQASVTTIATGAGPAKNAGPLLRWSVDVDFGIDTFRNGMDPIALLDYLRGLGSIQQIRCNSEGVPTLEVLHAEDCHLSFSLVLETAAPRSAIESAFSFVIDDCQLRIELLDSAPPEVGLEFEPETAAGDGSLAAATPRTADGASANTSSGEDRRIIRVQADRLDTVINLLGELIVAGAGAVQQARETRQTALIEANEEMGRLIEEIRNSTLQLRMVPIGETFGRFRRIVRDTAGELGKDVQLDIRGGDTELDKSIVERISDPLMHLVRNALDHGLETPAERLAAGKRAQGNLVLEACHESGSIVLRISDDGRGIQRDKVLRRAWERGLVEHGTVPADADIDALIFEPGFSTAEKVTNLSGRGVGMDVVRSNIEALRGTVALDSRPGEGSCIEIRLPLTLAIIDGFLVSVGNSKFIFPLEAVVEVVESRGSVAPYDSHGRSCIELRGQVLPVVSLRELYAQDSPPPPRTSVVVVRAGWRRYGIVVDQLMGQHQTVIKPLGRMFQSLRGMAGSTILGSGEVALIFDVVALGELAASAGDRARLRSSGPQPSDRNATALYS